MKQKISKRAIFQISAMISGAICLFAVIVIGITSNYSAQTAQAYSSAYWVTIDATDSHSDCSSTLGGTWTLGTKTCDITSPVTVTNKTVVVTNGVTLNGNGNLTIQFTSPHPNDPTWISGGLDSTFQQIGLILVGAPGANTPNPVTVDDVIVNINGNMDHGVVMEGNGTTLSNSVISGSSKSDILVTNNSSNFNLISNTTSGGTIGVEVGYAGTNGVIDDHTASSQSLYGIELYGTNNVDVTNSSLTGNDVYGLYIHDTTRIQVYGIIEGVDAPTNSTYNYVNGNTITGNNTYEHTSYDIAIDANNGSEWDTPAQSSASNTYNTISLINGSTFPGTQLTTGPTPPDPPPTLQTVDTFNLNVDVNAYTLIQNDCANSMILTVGNDGSTNLKAATGKRYGYADCKIHIGNNDPNGSNLVYVEKIQNQLLCDSNGVTFADIDNLGGDTTMDNTGNTDEEEFGFNISNEVLSSGTVQSDAGETTYAFNSANIFDLEPNATTDNIISNITICSFANCNFDFNLYANINAYETINGFTKYGTFNKFACGTPPCVDDYTARITLTTSP